MPETIVETSSTAHTSQHHDSIRQPDRRKKTSRKNDTNPRPGSKGVSQGQQEPREPSESNKTTNTDLAGRDDKRAKAASISLSADAPEFKPGALSTSTEQRSANGTTQRQQIKSSNKANKPNSETKGQGQASKGPNRRKNEGGGKSLPPNANKAKSGRFDKSRPMGQLSDSAPVAPSEQSSDPSVSREFPSGEPSQPVRTKPPRHRTHAHKKGKLDPAEIKDLLTSLTHGLETATYECMVCWDVVRQGHFTWSCNICWAVFHLPCIQKWAKKSLNEPTANSASVQWRCPGCQHNRSTIPTDYVCFCGKVVKPDFDRYITPHSCGAPCGRQRECPHECVLPCHPGPCPPCTAMSPPLPCFCGKETSQRRCVDTDYSSPGKSCGQVCGELLGCGKHTCEKECHPGLCPPCTVMEDQNCYCQRHGRSVKCGSGQKRQTFIDGTAFNGYYSCEEICKSLYDCGKHTCEKPCHPLPQAPDECPFEPSKVDHCPCGKTAMNELLESPRSSCSDPIPTCTQPCGKVLACNHTCQAKCHHGECPPCTRSVDIPCRCGSSTVFEKCRVVLSAGFQQPLCDRICRSLRDCGKHQCGVRCCSQMNKKQNKNAPYEGEEDNVHECSLICGKKLRCGVHSCQLPCHKGHCLPCLEASFDELSCHCGRTKIYPPVPCGTKLPRCNYPCDRTPACGHPTFTNHPCHPDEEPCPPCAVLVAKQCMCGKKEIKNVPCHRTAPSCGTVCDKPLPCGGHNCDRVCHSDPCLKEGEQCSQTCGKPRSQCGHPCPSPCHAPSICSEDQPCPTMIQVSCKCGQLSKDLPCNATVTSIGSNRTLPCNDFCALTERNRRLAVALDVTYKLDSEGQPLPPNQEIVYSDHLRHTYDTQREWCKSIEAMIDEFAIDSKRKVLNMAAMKGYQRRFVHDLVAVYKGLASESVDVEPYRSVIVRKRGPVTLPSLPLAKALTIQPTPEPATSPLEQLRKKKQAVNAIYCSGLSFGLVQDELDAEVAKVCSSVSHSLGLASPDHGGIQFKSTWTQDNDATLVPQGPFVEALDNDALEPILRKIAKELSKKCETGLAASITCCWIDANGSIRYTDHSSRPSIVTKQAPPPVPVANVFASLNADE